jgi:hypothetical protein
VESDYESVGYKAGLHLLSKACERVLFLTYYDQDDNGPTHVVDGNLPVGLQNGVLRAFSSKGFDAQACVCREVYKGYSPEVISQLKASVSAVEPGTGLIFSSGYQLLCLLQTYGDEIRQILHERPFVVASNASITSRLWPLMKGLDPMVMVDAFEQVAKIVVQKLVGMIDGLFDNTTVLVDVQCKRLSEILDSEESHENGAFPGNS